MINEIYNTTYINDCPYYFNGICSSRLNFKNKCNNFLPITSLCEYREKEVLKINEES